MKKTFDIKKVPLISMSLGIFSLVLGFYYEGIKAGIPYQDPTPEMSQKYMRYVYIGQAFYKIGFILIIIGCLGFIISKLILKKRNQGNN